MSHFVLRNFLGILRDDGIGEGDLTAANHATLSAGSGQHVGGQPRSEHCIRIELRFEVFEVQRKVQNIHVGD